MLLRGGSCSVVYCTALECSGIIIHGMARAAGAGDWGLSDHSPAFGSAESRVERPGTLQRSRVGDAACSPLMTRQTKKYNQGECTEIHAWQI